MSPTPTDDRPSARTQRRRALLVGLPLLALGAATTVAVAAPRVGGGEAGWRGHHGCKGAEVQSAAELRRHMDRGAGFLLDRVDATPEQEERVGAILDELAEPAFALKAEGQELRADVHASLDGGRVDAEALEEARQDGLDLADRASALALDAFVDLAAVLTPEQRAELAELHDAWRR